MNEESEPNESRTSLTPEENRRDIFSQEEMEERLTPEEKTREFAEEAEFPTHLEFSLVERVSPLMAPEVAYVWYVTVDGIAGAVLARLAYQVPDSELVVIIARDPTNRLLPVFSLPYTSALIEPIQETEDEIHFLANDVYNPLRDDIDLSFR